MTKNELKYVNSLKEDNERLKNLLLQFVEAIGKVTNLDDVANISGIPLMTEENQKIRANIKAEAIKEFAERLKGKTYPFPCAIGVEHAVTIRAIDDLAKEMVGDTDA
jgi:hypothetical protein